MRARELPPMTERLLPKANAGNEEHINAKGDRSPVSKDQRKRLAKKLFSSCEPVMSESNRKKGRVKWIPPGAAKGESRKDFDPECLPRCKLVLKAKYGDDLAIPEKCEETTESIVHGVCVVKGKVKQTWFRDKRQAGRKRGL